MSLFDDVMAAVDFLKLKTAGFKPDTGIILGTGLNKITSEIEISYRIPYKEIPHFAVSTVESHEGELIFGYIENKSVVVMSGRFHYYEGYSMSEVTFPVRVLKYLGIKSIVISNAAGGLKEHLYPGDIVFIRDHINLHAENPLRGDNDERFGVRFPDMLNTYDKLTNEKALSIAKELKIRAFEGVYVGTQGPNLETPAEYNYFNIIGGDVVGMSTVPEVIVAQHMNLKIFVVSIVSNRCFPINEIDETTVEEVIAVVNQAGEKLISLLKRLLVSMS